MELKLGEWLFQVDPEQTRHRTLENSKDHCKCGYCTNYYEAAPMVYPELISFLDQFGVNFHGPSEVMPFTPTCMLSCYRVQGRILRFGTDVLRAGEIPVLPEAADDDSFFLWVGEMMLPWLQEEAEEDVVSPANLPEFMERMEQIWLLRHGPESIQS